MEILKVENLTKTYGSGENLVHAVDDVSFSVEKGEFVAIVGASGSGKSTLLHLIGGVDRPTSGKIFVDGRGVDRERLEMILDSFGLRARRKHLPNQLSGGQQQRTSIARALINNPSLVLADEPTGNLDSKSSEEVMSMLKMCNQSYGQTVIMITHNLDIAKQADRIITISDGKIVEEV